jgi:hypothetical protein
MAGSAIVSVVEPGALHRAGSVCEDSGNNIGAEVTIHLFDHSAVRFHSESITQPYDCFARIVTAEMDIGFAVTFVSFQNSLEIL